MTMLFNNRLQRKLLSYLFTHPDERHYVRELAAGIEVPPGNLSRELRKLEREGILYSQSRGNLKFYRLNNHHPLYQELKSILFKTAGVQGSLQNLVSGYPAVVTAFLYGSYARGDESASSDIDLLVVGAVDRDRFTIDVQQLERKLGREINFNIYTRKEYEKEKGKEGSFLFLLLKEKIVSLKDGNDGRID